MVQRVDGHAAGIQGEKYGFFVAVLVCAYVVGEPAFHAAALVVISPAAFFVKVFPGFEAVNIEVTDIRTYFIKFLNELFIFRHV